MVKTVDYLMSTVRTGPGGVVQGDSVRYLFPPGGARYGRSVSEGDEPEGLSAFFSEGISSEGQEPAFAPDARRLAIVDPRRQSRAVFPAFKGRSRSRGPGPLQEGWARPGFVGAPVWAVHWLPSGASSAVGTSVRARGADARAELFSDVDVLE